MPSCCWRNRRARRPRRASCSRARRRSRRRKMPCGRCGASRPLSPPPAAWERSWRSISGRSAASGTTPASSSTFTQRGLRDRSEAAGGTTRCSAGSGIPAPRSDSRSTSTRWCRSHADDRAAERAAAEAGAGTLRPGGSGPGRGAGHFPQADHPRGICRPIRRPQGRRRASVRRTRSGGSRGLRDRPGPRVRRRSADAHRFRLRPLPPLSCGAGRKKRHGGAGQIAAGGDQVPATHLAVVRPTWSSGRPRPSLRIRGACRGQRPHRRDRGPGGERADPGGERPGGDRRDPPGHRPPGGEPRLVPAEGGGTAAAVGEARMIRILVLSNPADRAQALSLRATAGTGPEVSVAVTAIIADVRARGDAAVRELTERFDGARLESMFLDEARWDALAARCPTPVREALALAHERVRRFHEPQIPVSYSMELEGGGTLRSLTIPLGRAACYVPGGRAAYPSTVIMTVTPARLAGVPEVIVATPPRRDGSVPPEVAAAARIAGAAQILTAGGAQAIAALALGTRSVPRVDVIVGPGNAYVTEAKKQLSGEVRIDSLAGPTEVLIVADSSADPAWVAADLLAQAEHDPLALAVLVTPDPALADAVAASLTGPQFAAVLAGDLDQALAFADEFAPEHLELMVRDPRAAVDKVP